MRLTSEQFEALVQAGVRAIPERFRQLLKNVAIVVSDEPSASELTTAHVAAGSTLFGLYQGVPQTKRGAGYSSLPDKITIFKGPIERAAQTPDQVRQLVSDTVWHELAHHFGMDERTVRAAQRRRAQRR